MSDPVDTDALRAVAVKLLGEDYRMVLFAADEVDRLWAVIENAPHGWECAQETYNGHDDSIACTCWKADAL